MKLNRCIAIVASAFGLVAAAGPAASQSSVATAAPGATVVPNDGSLYSVTSGQFKIEEGQVIDITDENITFSFDFDRDNDRFYCYINGGYLNCKASLRIDLKAGRVVAGAGLRGFDSAPFKNTDRCHIDVVSFAVVRGAPVSGVFRLDCF